MRVVVTGGAGHIGGMLVARLAEQLEVGIYDVANSDTAPAGVEQHIGDLADLDALTKAFSGADVVVHLAAIPMDLPDEAPRLMEVNCVGTFNVFEAAARAGVRRVVFASSICAVGFMFTRLWTPDYFPVDERHPTKPDSMYGLSKEFGEQLARAYTDRHGIETVCLRLSPVWFDDMRPFTTFCVAGLVRPEINQDGIWSYVDVRDAVEAIRLATTVHLEGRRIYNIGAAEVAAQEDSLALIGNHYPDVPVVRMPAFAENPRAPLWDISSARADLGYEPSVDWRPYLDRVPPELLDAARELPLDEFRDAVFAAAAR